MSAEILAQLFVALASAVAVGAGVYAGIRADLAAMRVRIEHLERAIWPATAKHRRYGDNP